MSKSVAIVIDTADALCVGIMLQVLAAQPHRDPSVREQFARVGAQMRAAAQLELTMHETVAGVVT